MTSADRDDEATLHGGAPMAAVSTRDSARSARSASTTRLSLRDKMNRALSPGRASGDGTRERHSSLFQRANMSEERGREARISTGRGGAGNLVRSLSRGGDPEAGAERGREVRSPSQDRATHAGRGGAGNIRSPSRDPKRDRIEEAQEDALQGKLIAERRGRQADAPFSSGRGGAGNITDSRSRSRSAARGESPRLREDSRTRATATPTHGFRASGRGGYGNITEENGASDDPAKSAADRAYEADVKKKYEEHEAGMPHSVGRGGAGGIGHTYDPVDISKLSIEQREAQQKVAAADAHNYRSGGRGGAGNMTAPDERGRGASGTSGAAHGGGVFGSMLRSLSRAAGRDTSAAAK